MSSMVLKRVRYVPRELSSGTLYVSEEYAVAVHLCACGCGNKVVTPLGPAEYSFEEADSRPSLWPSIGNWQLPCRSHYFIRQGRVQWAERWSDDEIKQGRLHEQRRRKAYYESREYPNSFWSRARRALRKMSGR